MIEQTIHVCGNGAGLKLLGQKTYGSGYCGICGDRPVPQLVRFWSSDDGWTLAVLCAYCARECVARGPRPTDYAYATRRPARLDILADLVDPDAAISMSEE